MIASEPAPVLLSTRDVAEAFGVSTKTIQLWITLKKLVPQGKLRGRTGAYYFAADYIADLVRQARTT